MTDETVSAFAPGSVTTMFSPTDGSGSLGVSLATADGVTATVRPADRTTIQLDGTRTAFEPVAGVLDRLGVTCEVRLDAAIPVGAGFGASGAATLATALAADAAVGLERDRADLVTASHRAEVTAGTGLGDVFVQEGGGLAYDIGDGRTRRFPDTTLSYVSHGGIPTADLLDDDAAIGRIRSAAETAFVAFDPAAPLTETLAIGRRFAADAGLLTDRVRETLDRVAAAGGVGTMAMIGETIVVAGVDGSLGTEDGLGAAWKTTRIARDGARLLDQSDDHDP